MFHTLGREKDMTHRNRQNIDKFKGQDTEQFNFIKLHETDRAVLVGLEKERIPTPGLQVKGATVNAIITYGRAWFPKSRCAMSGSDIEVPQWMLSEKRIDDTENQFMVFDTEAEGF